MYVVIGLLFQVQLYIYFMLKFAMEILLSESSVVTQYYFAWGTRSVALFLALLGLTVLPVNWVVGSYASNLFQDRYKTSLKLLIFVDKSVTSSSLSEIGQLMVRYVISERSIGRLTRIPFAGMQATTHWRGDIDLRWIDYKFRFQIFALLCHSIRDRSLHFVCVRWSAWR